MEENKTEETNKSKERNNVQGEIEAILFASGEPVKISRLAQFLEISQKDCRNELESLSSFYKKNQRGLELIFKLGQVQMVSEADFGEVAAKFLNKESKEDLSRAALEVLAVIAYRGPISRAEIEYIRGVNCSFTLRNLAMRGLIDRSENPNDSRSYLYEISFDCLGSLGISKVQELFDYDNLSRKESVEETDKEKKIKGDNLS